MDARPISTFRSYARPKMDAACFIPRMRLAHLYIQTQTRDDVP